MEDNGGFSWSRPAAFPKYYYPWREEVNVLNDQLSNIWANQKTFAKADASAETRLHSTSRPNLQPQEHFSQPFDPFRIMKLNGFAEFY